MGSQHKNKTPVREHSFTWSKYDITNLSGTSTASEVMHKISYEDIMKAITKDLYPSQGPDHDKDGDKEDEVDYYITPEGINRIPFSDMNTDNLNYKKVTSNYFDPHASNRSLTTSTITEATPNNSPTRSQDIYDLKKASNELRLVRGKNEIKGFFRSTGIKTNDNTEIGGVKNNESRRHVIKASSQGNTQIPILKRSYSGLFDNLSTSSWTSRSLTLATTSSTTERDSNDNNNYNNNHSNNSNNDNVNDNNHPVENKSITEEHEEEGEGEEDHIV